MGVSPIRYPEGPIAQWLEQATHNRLVVGSNPTGPTNLAFGEHLIRFRLLSEPLNLGLVFIFSFTNCQTLHNLLLEYEFD